MAKAGKKSSDGLKDIIKAQGRFDRGMRRLDNRIKRTDQKLRTFQKLNVELEEVVTEIGRLANGKGSKR